MGGRRYSLALLEGGCAVDTHRLRRAREVETFERQNIETSNAHLASVAFARIKSSSVITRHVPVAAHHVVDVLAKSGSLGSILACTDAERIESHEVLDEVGEV